MGPHKEDIAPLPPKLLPTVPPVQEYPATVSAPIASPLPAPEEELATKFVVCEGPLFPGGNGEENLHLVACRLWHHVVN